MCANLRNYFDWYNIIKYVIILSAIFILLFLFMDKIFMPIYVRLGDEIDVPDVVKKSDIEAIAELEQLGFFVEASEQKYDNRYAPGTVIAQFPLPNTRVKRGRTIHLTICLGEQKVSVPNLKGIFLRDAEIQLAQRSLQKGEINYRPSTMYPQGMIINQSYEPGAIVNKGTIINLTVSSSQEAIEVIVPNLLNKTLMSARDIILKNNLKVGLITYIVNKDYLPNTVLLQFPEAGTMTFSGDSVLLYVSKIDSVKR